MFEDFEVIQPIDLIEASTNTNTNTSMIETHMFPKLRTTALPSHAGHIVITRAVNKSRSSASRRHGSVRGSSADHAIKSNGGGSSAPALALEVFREVARPRIELLVARTPDRHNGPSSGNSGGPATATEHSSFAAGCLNCDHDHGLVLENTVHNSLNGDNDAAWVDSSSTDDSDDETVDHSAGHATPVVENTSGVAFEIPSTEKTDRYAPRIVGCNLNEACVGVAAHGVDRSLKAKSFDGVDPNPSPCPGPASKVSSRVPLSKAIDFVLGKWAAWIQQQVMAKQHGYVEGANITLQIPKQLKHLLQTEERCSADTPRLFIDADEVGTIDLSWKDHEVPRLVEHLISVFDSDSGTQATLQVDLNDLATGDSCKEKTSGADSREKGAVQQHFDGYLANALHRYEVLCDDISELIGKLEDVKEKYWEKGAFLQAVSDRRSRAWESEADDEDEEKSSAEDEQSEDDNDDECRCRSYRIH